MSIDNKVKSIGDGESSLRQGLFDQSDADAIFAVLRGDEEVTWQHMYQRGDVVPRMACTQGLRLKHEDGWKSYPLFRHPVDVLPHVLPFSPSVQKIKDALEQLPELKARGQKLNHVLIQMYRNGKDSISAHSDKTMDLEPGSFIVNVSLGASREMIIRSKTRTEDGSRTKESFLLHHNSVFCLDLGTNATHTHEIRQDKRLDRFKTESEKSFDGIRISLTFRAIATHVFYRRNPSTLIYREAVIGRAGVCTSECLKKTSCFCSQKETMYAQYQYLRDHFSTENKSVSISAVEDIPRTSAKEGSWVPRVAEDILDAVVDFYIEIQRKGICGSDHGLAHVLAVMQNMQMALSTDAYLQNDVPHDTLIMLTLAALCHDLNDRKILKEMGNVDNCSRLIGEFVSEYDLKLLKSIIDTVSTSSNGNMIPPVGREYEALPHEVDALEAIGQVGIDRCIAYSKRIGNPMYTDETICVVNEEELQAKVNLAARFRKYTTGEGKSASVVDHAYDKLFNLNVVHSGNEWIQKQMDKRMKVMKDAIFALNRQRQQQSNQNQIKFVPKLKV